MPSSRDTSVLRSLAVAFGDGLAFGVGMKLTQTAATRPSGPAPVIGTGSDRLALLEERIRRIERTPAPLPAPAAAPAKFDQQVLDALVNAVETRLQEQSAATERRMADLEARLAMELKAVHEEVRSLAEAAEIRIRETQSAAQQEVAVVRRELAELAAGRRNDAAAIAQGLEKIGLRILALERNRVAESEAAGQQVAAVSARVDHVSRTLVEGYDALRTQIADFDRKTAVTESRFTAALAAHAQEVADAVTAGEEKLRAEIAEIGRRIDAVAGSIPAHEHEPLARGIAEVSQRLENFEAGVERTVDAAILAGMANAERRLLEQVGEASEHASAVIARDAETAVDRKIAPLAAAVTELQAKAAASEAKTLATLQAIGQACLDVAGRPEPAPPAAATPPDLPEPKPANGTTEMQPAALFEEARKSSRVWRIPLVSSLLAGAAGLAVLRFLV